MECSAFEEPDRFNGDAWRQLDGDALFADGLDRLQPAVKGVGVGVVEKVNGVSGARLPAEHFNEARTVDGDGGFIVRKPANGVVEKAQEIAMASKPEGAFDVAGRATRGGCCRTRAARPLAPVCGRGAVRPAPEDSARSRERR